LSLILRRLICNAINFSEKGTIKFEFEYYSKNETIGILNFKIIYKGRGLHSDLLHLKSAWYPFVANSNEFNSFHKGYRLNLAKCETLSKKIGPGLKIGKKPEGSIGIELTPLFHKYRSRICCRPHRQ